MAEPKTRPTRASVKSFLDGVRDPTRRRDARAVDRMMRRVTGEKPVMWGPSIVGYGSYDIRYASGRSLQWPVAAFSPRSTAVVVYITPAFAARGKLLARLGRHSIGRSCLYIKRLDDVDVGVLESLVRESVNAVR